MVVKVKTRPVKETISSAEKSPMPKRVKPMLATLVNKPFDDPDWIFEVKWDGVRALAGVTRAARQAKVQGLDLTGLQMLLKEATR